MEIKEIYKKLLKFTIIHNRASRYNITKHQIQVLDQLVGLKSQITASSILMLLECLIPKENTNEEDIELKAQLLALVAKEETPSLIKEEPSTKEAEKQKHKKSKSEDCNSKEELLKLCCSKNTRKFLCFIVFLYLFELSNENKKWCLDVLNTNDFASAMKSPEKSEPLDLILSRIFSLTGRSNDFSLVNEQQLLKLLEEGRQARQTFTPAVVINCLIQRYLESGWIIKSLLLEKSGKFPQKNADPYEESLNFYLCGKTEALRHEYKTALNLVSKAFLKLPGQNNAATLSLRFEIAQLHTLISLLLGDLSNEYKEILKDSVYSEKSGPYIEIFEEVEAGNNEKFEELIEKHAATFRKDKIYSLMSRLKESTTQKSLKNINSVYSRISLKDVAKRIGGISALDAELMMAKAIASGNVAGIISGDNFESEEVPGVYTSAIPLEEFNIRINSCVDITRCINNAQFHPEKKKDREKIKEVHQIEGMFRNLSERK